MSKFFLGSKQVPAILIPAQESEYPSISTSQKWGYSQQAFPGRKVRENFPWQIMMCCSSSCEPDSEPIGVNEEIFGWTCWFLLEAQFCSLATLPLCFSFCWKRVTRRNVPLCSKLLTLGALWALLAPQGPGVSFSASLDALELFLCCSVGFFEAELSI